VIRTILFDLDGTLADTAPDLAAALNAVRVKHGFAAMPFESIRPHVSNGSIALVKIGFGEPDDVPEFNTYRDELLAAYQENIAEHTCLFDGMQDVLAHIEAHEMNWGVVTNKPAYLTLPLMQALGLHERAACIVSGDTITERKPHPAPILHACRLAGSQADECVYVGDAARDIEAGRAAGMQTLVALFGYIGEDEKPESWGATAMISHPTDIIEWCKQE
jgi:phosphoglycolate phosphatase